MPHAARRFAEKLEKALQTGLRLNHQPRTVLVETGGRFPIGRRYARFKGYDTTQGGMTIREFSDYESISGYAMDAMTWAVNTGVISGYEGQALHPRANATRAQVAQMLKNFLENA